MQGGDERQLLRLRHQPRQQGAHRVRDCIVNVQQVQRNLFRYLNHLRRQRQCVRRMVKQRIRSDLYLVKVDPLVRGAQSNGHRIANEMDLVPTSGQLNPQLGSHHSRAAIRWIARDPNFHECPWQFNSRSPRAASASPRLHRIAAGC